MLSYSGVLITHGRSTYRQPLNGYTSQSVTSHFATEPIDCLLSELQRPNGFLSTVRTAVGVGNGVKLKKKELSRHVDSFQTWLNSLVHCC